MRESLGSPMAVAQDRSACCLPFSPATFSKTRQRRDRPAVFVCRDQEFASRAPTWSRVGRWSWQSFGRRFKSYTPYQRIKNERLSFGVAILLLAAATGSGHDALGQCREFAGLRATGTKLVAMSVESIPKFTDPARKLWATIPADKKRLLLSNVWCGGCRHGVAIKNFTGAVKSGDLLLVGECSECHGDVARLIEMS